MAVVASARMVKERAIEFGNLVRSIWSAELGTIFAAADNRDDVKVPDGMEVASLGGALARCAMCLLLWDEDIQRSVANELKNYCETGGWLVFVSCSWIGSPPKSSPAELLRHRGLGGMAHLGASVVARQRRAVAMLKHPSIPDLPVGEALRVYLRSGKALGGGDGRAIPLLRFQEPALRGVNIRAVGRGGTIEVNWDCPAGGRIGETESEEFIKTILAWLAEKETWREPVEQPGVPLKIIARTPTGDRAPGAEIAVKLHTDWARSVSQEIVIVGENGEGEVPAKAPAIYTAWAAGEGYSSDTLALARVEEGTAPEPLMVTVRPGLRIVGTAVYTGEASGLAPGVQVDLLPSSRARGIDVVSTETDDEGRFGFEGVPGGRPYVLQCETEEWAGLEEIDLPESTDTGTFEVTLSLKKLVTIDGRVVEEGGEQKPIEGATVLIEPYRGVKALPLFLEHLRGQSTSTGDDGGFRLPVLPDVTYQIRAEASGYVWRNRGSDRTREGSLEVRAPTLVTLELGRGTAVRGTVYLPGGQPAPAARVTLSPAWGEPNQTADLSGKFRFPCVRLPDDSALRLKYVTILAEWAEFSVCQSASFPIEQSEIEIVVGLQEAPVIHGVVTDPTGHPLTGAGIYHVSREKPPLTHSDGNGLFAVPLLEPKQLFVWKEGYETVCLDEELEVAAAKDDLLRVILLRSNGRIAGKVVLHDGTPLRNHEVDLLPMRARDWSMSLGWQRGVILGDQGEFVLEGLRIDGLGSDLFEVPVEFVDLYVEWYPDHGSRDLRLEGRVKDVPLGASDVLVRIGPVFELHGRMVDGRNGAPIEGVSIHCWNRNSTSDASGEFRICWLTPREYELTATHTGFFPLRQKINAAPVLSDLGQVFLYSEIIVQGQAIYEGSGMPAEGAEVLVSAGWKTSAGKDESADCGTGATDSAGRFSVRASAPSFSPGALSYRVSVGVLGRGGGSWIKLDCSRAVPPGLLDIGRVEVMAPKDI